jgi:hypothetical protein
MAAALSGHALPRACPRKAVGMAPELSFDVRRTASSVSYAAHSPKGAQSPANAGSRPDARNPTVKPDKPHDCYERIAHGVGRK